MANVITGDTQLGATKAQVIAALVQKELAFQAMFMQSGAVTDVSMFAVKGAKSISFPKTGNMTVSNRASGTAVDAQALTFSNDTMALNINAYCSWLIDGSDEFQSNIEVLQEYIKRASSAHARYLDNKIMTELETIAGTTLDGSDLTDANILALRQSVLANNANRGNLFMAVSVDQEAKLLGIDKFVRADAMGASNIPNGVIGRIYGMTCFVSNGLEAGQALVWDKDAIAVGFQKAAKYAEQSKIEYGTDSKLCAVDQLYGVKGLLISGSTSPLVAKLQANS